MRRLALGTETMFHILALSPPEFLQMIFLVSFSNGGFKTAQEWFCPQSVVIKIKYDIIYESNWHIVDTPHILVKYEFGIMHFF